MHDMVLMSMLLTAVVFAIDYFSIVRLKRKLAALNSEVDE